MDKDKALNLALDAASKAVHMMLLREGSSWGVKACEEMGLVFMNAYHKELPASEWVGLTDEELLNAYGWYEMVEKNRFWEDTHPMLEKARQDILVGLRNIENKLKEKNGG